MTLKRVTAAGQRKGQRDTEHTRAASTTSKLVLRRNLSWCYFVSGYLTFDIFIVVSMSMEHTDETIEAMLPLTCSQNQTTVGNQRK
jgi:hypothetical protein